MRGLGPEVGLWATSASSKTKEAHPTLAKPSYCFYIAAPAELIAILKHATLRDGKWGGSSTAWDLGWRSESKSRLRHLGTWALGARWAAGQSCKSPFWKIGSVQAAQAAVLLGALLWRVPYFSETTVCVVAFRQ